VPVHCVDKILQVIVSSSTPITMLVSFAWTEEIVVIRVGYGYIRFITRSDMPKEALEGEYKITVNEERLYIVCRKKNLIQYSLCDVVGRKALSLPRELHMKFPDTDEATPLLLDLSIEYASTILNRCFQLCVFSDIDVTQYRWNTSKKKVSSNALSLRKLCTVREGIDYKAPQWKHCQRWIKTSSSPYQ